MGLKINREISKVYTRDKKWMLNLLWLAKAVSYNEFKFII